MLKRINLINCIAISNIRRLPSPYKATFVLTYRCNLKCKICSIWKKLCLEELGIREIERIFKNFRNLSWLDLTGGEVTLRDDIMEVIKVIAMSARNALIFHISTNGQLPERATLMAKEVIKSSLVPVINISIDGPRELNDKLRGVSGAFDNGIETFLRLKRIKKGHYYLSCTISKYNIKYIDEMLSELKRQIADFSYSDIHFNVFHASQHYYNNIDVEGAEGLDFTVVKKYLSLAGNGNLIKTFLEKRYINGTSKFFSGNRFPVKCQALNATCFIDPSGMVYPCGIYDSPVGNLLSNDCDINKIWNQPNVHIVRSKIEEQHCPGCWSPCEAYPAILGSTMCN